MEQDLLEARGFDGLFLQVRSVSDKLHYSTTSRLILEYSRLMSLDRESMSFNGDGII